MENSWGCCSVVSACEEHLDCSYCKKKFHLSCLDAADINDSNSSTPWLCYQCSVRSYSATSATTPCHMHTAARPLKRQALNSPPNTEQSASISEIQNIVESTIKIQVENLITQLHTKIRSIVSTELKSIVDDIRDMKNSLEYMHSQVETISKENCESRSKITELQKQNTILKTTVDDLKHQINILQQNSRANNVEIQCIPENRNENIVEVVQQIAKVINCKINPENISHCTRVAKVNRQNSRPRAIIVQFNGTKTRDEFLAASNFNRKKPVDKKLNTSHLGFAEPASPIFVVEHLSPSNKNLHAAARSAAKEKGYKYVWVRRGRIYMRKGDDSDYIIIKDLSCLNGLK
ncbi:unnamed protein product [Euphydryas editha]|uniref:FP protein C-terminal domain-containing protein n=1 Tax=Euphydryas editha TaxID=104508 RepID=A0AAU9UCK0_EUPED|nr:unnamed protein product [Euphydryas editha]